MDVVAVDDRQEALNIDRHLFPDSFPVPISHRCALELNFDRGFGRCVALGIDELTKRPCPHFDYVVELIRSCVNLYRYAEKSVSGVETPSCVTLLDNNHARPSDTGWVSFQGSGIRVSPSENVMLSYPVSSGRQILLS
jgi:hypothetical protein